MQLLEWILGRRRKQTVTDPRRIAETLKSKIASLQGIPMLPEGAIKAMAVAKSPDVSLEDLALVIAPDPALTASILKLANSVLFRTGRPTETLVGAVVRIGLRQCYNLILTAAMRSLFCKLPKGQQGHFECLWRHSLLTACVCRELNLHLSLGFRHEEFTCGLTHDIGRMLIGIGTPEQFEAIDPVDFLEGPEVLAREQEVLGTDHCEVGAWFASQNQLPTSVIECIQFHHVPADAGKYRGLAAVVSTADHMANYSQARTPP